MYGERVNYDAANSPYQCPEYHCNGNDELGIVQGGSTLKYFSETLAACGNPPSLLVSVTRTIVWKLAGKLLVASHVIEVTGNIVHNRPDCL